MKNDCDVNFFNCMECEYPDCEADATCTIPVGSYQDAFSCDKHREILPKERMEKAFKLYWKRWKDVFLETRKINNKDSIPSGGL